MVRVTCRLPSRMSWYMCLSDNGAHSDAPDNLMRAETAPGNVLLNQEQCSALRSRGAANGLLTPRVLKP